MTHPHDVAAAINPRGATHHEHWGTWWGTVSAWNPASGGNPPNLTVAVNGATVTMVARYDESYVPVVGDTVYGRIKHTRTGPDIFVEGKMAGSSDTPYPTIANSYDSGTSATTTTIAIGSSATVQSMTFTPPGLSGLSRLLNIDMSVMCEVGAGGAAGYLELYADLAVVDGWRIHTQGASGPVPLFVTKRVNAPAGTAIAVAVVITNDAGSSSVIKATAERIHVDVAA